MTFLLKLPLKFKTFPLPFYLLSDQCSSLAAPLQPSLTSSLSTSVLLYTWSTSCSSSAILHTGLACTCSLLDFLLPTPPAPDPFILTPRVHLLSSLVPDSQLGLICPAAWCSLCLHDGTSSAAEAASAQWMGHVSLQFHTVFVPASLWQQAGVEPQQEQHRSSVLTRRFSTLKVKSTFSSTYTHYIQITPICSLSSLLPNSLH